MAYSWFRNGTTCDLKVIGLDGTGERMLVSGDREAPSARTEIWPFVWTPDGQYFYFAKGSGRKLGSFDPARPHDHPRSGFGSCIPASIPMTAASSGSSAARIAWR